MKINSLFQTPHCTTPRRLVVSLLITLLSLALAREAAALPLAHEGFQYVPGQPLPTMIGGFGWAPGPWTGSSQMVDMTPTLSYPTALPSSGDALFNPAPGEAFRYFGVPFNNSANDVWFSFQEKTVAAGSGTFVDLQPTSGVDIQVNKDGLGNITLNGVAAGSSAGVGNVDFFLIQVAQFSGGVTWVNLYLNPGVPLGPPNASFPIPSVYQANQFYFRTDPNQWLDEIWAGTTPQDVAGVAGGGITAKFFRVVGPSATTITSFGPDGTLVFSNAIVGSTYTIQTAFSLTGGNGWMNDHSVIASNNVVNDSNLIEVNPLFLMADIPGGTFTMGDMIDQLPDALPVFNVKINEFYMDPTPVRYADWRTVVTYGQAHGFIDLPSGAGKKVNHPVQQVSWYDIVKWCNARSMRDGLTPVYYTSTTFTVPNIYKNGFISPYSNTYIDTKANGYRLPTEAEWEYAARGGMNGLRFPWGNTIAWSQANYFGHPASLDPVNGFTYDLATAESFDPAFEYGSEPYTSPVASFKANGFGLYDMAGNIAEWCQDWYGTPYSGGTEPQGPASGTARVFRGGSWYDPAYYARCAARQQTDPGTPDDGIGFRCVRKH